MLGSNINTLASHLWGRWLKSLTLCGKVGSCLPMVGSLQYKTLTNCMYWFDLPQKYLSLYHLYNIENNVKPQTNK